MLKFCAPIAVALSVFAWVVNPTLGAPRYNIVALDPLPVPPGEDPFGYQSFAYAINNQGVVVGESTLNTSGHIGQTRPVMWAGSSQAQELWDNQTFGGKGLAINEAGFVVGRYGSGTGVPLPGPGIPDGGGFIWNPSTREFKDLGDLGGARVEATGINDAGQVSGSSESPEVFIIDGEPVILPVPRAFIWDEVNGMRDLGTLDGPGSRGTDMNEAGKVVGWSLQSDGTHQAFIWDAPNGMQALPTGGSSQAIAINDYDQVVGSVHGMGGFVWSQEMGVQFIGLAPNDINNLGQVVGLNGSIWDPVNGLHELRSLLQPGHGWEIWDATSINDAGQIVGYGRIDEQIRAFIATPVPEPSSIVLLTGYTSIAWAWQRWKSRESKAGYSNSFSK